MGDGSVGDGDAARGTPGHGSRDPSIPQYVLDGDRLAALRQTGLLDSGPEEEFDRFTRMAALLIEAPIARLSLVDEEAQHFKSAIGPLPASGRSTRLTHAICKHVVGDQAPVRIDDTAQDARVADNGAVLDDGTGAYLGVPVRSPDGHVLGSLCVADLDAHSWSERDLEILADLAHAVETELSLRAALAAAHGRAYRDPLTGLDNRRALSADLEEAVDTGRSVLLVLADLDGFKAYNDRYGHGAGDRMLVQLTRSLRHAAARIGGRAYRMSGDEFCVMCEDRGDRTVQIEAVRQSLQRPHGECPIGASAGAVSVPGEAISAADAMQLADERMYAHKRVGRLSTAGQVREAFSTMLGLREPALAALGNRAGQWATAAAAALGLDAVAAADVRLACELADIGTLAPDVPTEDHPLVGAETITAIPALAHLARLIRTHHEHHDGTGFPAGLSGDQLSLDQRLVSACTAVALSEATLAQSGPVTPRDALVALTNEQRHDSAVTTALATAAARLDTTAPAPGP